MRRWITYLSWALIAIIVGIEVKSDNVIEWVAKLKELEKAVVPGMGIKSMVLIDGILLYSWSVIKLGAFLSEKVLTPAVKICNFLFFLAMLIFSFVIIGRAVTQLMLMISLLLAVPFGTIVYMVKYAEFQTTTALAILGMLFALKLSFTASLVVGEKRLFEDYRTFLLLLLFSFIANFLINFLHAIAPGFLVSITDAVAAIVVAVIAIIWLLYMFLDSLWGVITLLLDAVGIASR
ncbi:MAG: hypothetical protein SD837_21105 [Candidatus Electrothrix scaldis]|nr:MAG: hypothetical protein SD837_21105 [Candidatus Electrothrix sp. GW3-3]